MSDAPKVAIVMGSDSDLPTMKSTVKVMMKFDVPFELRVLSAHRSPEETHKFAESAENRGIKVIIAGAGGAAHLAGVIAANTTVPVIGVPMATDRAGGMDSLLSTLQMPRGVPVGTMGIGSSGAQNAGLLAIEILALSDDKLAELYRQFKNQLSDSVEKANEKAQEWLQENS
ncbi:MAG: 5-(carboxyamino)imidazole ribonucleotide mutase [Candidatus Brocadiia bacterium]|nr:5-(carboxyamino)imidazole ribonucleotide mutase [Planctomycetota bacterium]